MSFNNPENSFEAVVNEKSAKFPKVSSLSSLKTQPDVLMETEAVIRKISFLQKERFIQMITVQNFNMKEAAKKTGISYSTAKKVYSRFRKTIRGSIGSGFEPQSEALECGFLQIPENQINSGRQLMVISTIAGRQQERRLVGK